MLPDFLVIGAQRAGTTWLYHCLKAHPQVDMPETKELHFFDSGFDHGRAWYEQQFDDLEDGAILGEATPNYLDHPEAAERMSQIVPDARLIAILREPVGRAYSAYELFREKRYADIPFHQACTQSGDLYRIGCYDRHLKRLYEYFAPSQVGIWLYDELQNDPRSLVRSVYEFLGADPSFVPPSLEERTNAVLLPRLQSFIGSLGLGRALEAFKSSRLGRRLKNRLATSKRRARPADVLTPQQHAEIREMFEPSIRRLEELIDRDLDAWRQPSS